jgi:elongator complex protein 3
MKKASRTISGVTPVAVMAKPFPCPGQCIYCPSSPEAPKSYTIESPAVLRARSCGFDASKQVEIRLKTLAEMGHARDKVELIIMGGTFLSYPCDYQYQFVKDCYDALNGVTSSSLEEAKKLNENAEHRCVGLCIETRPDFCGEEEITRMLDFGATRVELGVQTLDDEIHCLTRRGHGVAEVISATRLLRDRGFKVYYHWMPGLPGSTPEHDLELSRQLFEDARFRPDGLKLYPTLVVRGSELEGWYRDNRYRPYRDEVMIDLLVAIKSLIPKYVRISRLMRDIPRKFIMAGSRDLALRGTIRKKMDQANVRCSCIRCREYGHRRRDGWAIGGPCLTRLDYETLGGREVFLSYEDVNETLFGLLRLRINKGVQKPYGGEPLVGSRKLGGGKSLPYNYGLQASSNTDSALVRELHVFGPEVALGERVEEAAQHHGLGEKLLREAERIAGEEFKADRLSVLSGVGAREYYRSLGYALKGAFMVKDLD